MLGTGEAEMNKSDKNCLSDSLCSNGGDKEPTRKQSETVIDREVMSPILGKECHQWLKLGAWEGLGAGGGVLHRMGKESLAEGMASGLGGRSYKEVAKWETGGRVFQAAGTASAKAPRRDVRAVTGKQTEATESWGARRYDRREAGAQSKGDPKAIEEEFAFYAKTDGKTFDGLLEIPITKYSGQSKECM